MKDKLKEIKKSITDLKNATKHLKKAIDDTSQSARQAAGECWVQKLFETADDLNG